MTVLVKHIAVDEDCTCEGCKKVIDKHWAGTDELLKYAKEKGLKVDVEAIEGHRPLRYQTVKFL